MSGDYGKVFAALRAANETAWRGYTRHAFVQQLGDGSLPREAFLHYLRQDYVFLIHFSRAWALAIVKSQTLAEMQGAVGTVNALISEEIQLHIETCKAAGISEEELFETSERPENLAYTRFVLEAGYSGDLLDLLAALVPCVLGYGEIGAALKAEASSKSYQDWIDTYSGEEYQGACRAVGRLFDAVCISRIGENFENSPRWASISQTFKTATELEIGFWQMGLEP